MPTDHTIYLINTSHGTVSDPAGTMNQADDSHTHHPMHTLSENTWSCGPQHGHNYYDIGVGCNNGHDSVTVSHNMGGTDKVTWSHNLDF